MDHSEEILFRVRRLTELHDSKEISDFDFRMTILRIVEVASIEDLRILLKEVHPK